MTYTLDELRTIVGRYAKQYGAERVYLFGSRARGDARLDSDIDLRVDRGKIRGLQFAAFWNDLEDALGIPVDLIPTVGMDSDFRESIRPDEVLLYEQSAA